MVDYASNLLKVITGRIAVKDTDEVICYNVPKGFSPKECNKKLTGYEWEVTVGKSGEHTKTRFYLESDNSEVDSCFVVALKKEGVTERYSIEDGDSGEPMDNEFVTALLAEKGKIHGNDFHRKFTKVMSQGCSLLKDKKRPLTEVQRAKILAAHDKLYAEYRRLLTDTPAAPTTKAGIPDLI